MKSGALLRVIASCATAIVPVGSASAAAASAATSHATLTSLVPHGVTDCGPLPKSDYDPGVVGVAATTFCFINHFGGHSTLYAYQLDNAGDYATSLAAINKHHGFDPAAVSTQCPDARNSFGIVPWSSSGYPAKSGQVLECQEGVDKTGDPFVTPQYTWTLPTKNVVFIAVSKPHVTMADLQSWWVKNSGTNVQTKSIASPGTSLSKLLSIMPMGTTNCDPTLPTKTVAGTAGFVTGINCSLPQVGTLGTAFGYVFDNAADYATSLAALNTFKGIDPASAGDSCPLASGETVGIVPWHYGSFPPLSGQNLECVMVTNGGTGPADVPEYIWTVPSENTILDVIGKPNTTTQQLGAWWTANAKT
jgi:hypothetical protein